MTSRADKAVGLIASVERSDGYRFLAWRTDKGDYVQAGCRFLAVTDYKMHIAKEYPNTDKAKETSAILAFFATRFADTQKGDSHV